MAGKGPSRFGVVVFPGTWSDRDCFYALAHILKQDVRYIWHKETDLSGCDCVVLPGGFSYGDYLRPGSIACFSPVMGEVKRFAREGRMVIGICNGFQILCEAGMLPGALLPNCHLRYCCQWIYLKAEGFDSAFASKRNAKILRMPISHYEGNYYAPPDILEELEAEHRVAFRYSTPEGRIESEVNPNGSLNNIAGILNKRGNVLGMMPHPERACEELLGSVDGNLVWQSIMDAI